MNSSTPGSLSPEQLFKNLPDGLRKPLIDAYNEIVRHYREGRWEPSALNGGKLCEIIYSIVKGAIDGKFPDKPQKPRNMVDACRALEQLPSAGKLTGDRSLRIQIPRQLLGLYEIRNNRGVGHVGGDVDSNHMDATLVLATSKWLVAELIRIFHNVDVQVAAAYVDQLVDRTIPAVWRIGDIRRVLSTSLTMTEKTLILLYDAGTTVSEQNLVAWVEHSNTSIFRRDILRTLHKKRLVEYDAASRAVTLSPLGVKYVEDNDLLEAESVA